jgi:ketosteroid isomerase-like protein
MAESNREIWRKVREAWTANDHATLARYVDPEMEIVEPDSLPYHGVFRGVEGYVELFRQISTVWEELTIEQGQIIGAEADNALVIEYFTTARSRKSGEWLKRDPNLAIWKFRDGKVISMTPFNFDTAKIIAVANGE